MVADAPTLRDDALDQSHAVDAPAVDAILRRRGGFANCAPHDTVASVGGQRDVQRPSSAGSNESERVSAVPRAAAAAGRISIVKGTVVLGVAVLEARALLLADTCGVELATEPAFAEADAERDPLRLDVVEIYVGTGLGRVVAALAALVIDTVALGKALGIAD